MYLTSGHKYLYWYMYCSICQALKKRTTLDSCRSVKAGHYSCPYLSSVFSILICIHVYMYTSSFMVQNYILCVCEIQITYFVDQNAFCISLYSCLFIAIWEYTMYLLFRHTPQPKHGIWKQFSNIFFSVYITQIPISVCKCSVTFNLV